MDSEANKVVPQGKLDLPVGNLSLFYLIRQWLRQSYDELGHVLMVGIFFTVVVFVAMAPLAFSSSYRLNGSLWGDSWEIFSLSMLFGGLWLSVCAWMSVHSYLEEILTFQYPDWLTFWRVFPRYMVRSLWVLLSCLIVFGILFFDVVVYPSMFANHPYLQVAALVVTSWMILFLAMVQVHLVPFLVHQDKRFFTAVKRAAMVAVWKPARAFLLAVIQVAFLIACLGAPPLVFLVPGVFAILSVLSLLILLDEWRDPYEKTPEAIRAGE